MKSYKLEEIYTTTEAAEKYNINLYTLKHKLKPSIVGEDNLKKWEKKGIIKKSGSAWLLTDDVIKLIMKK